MDPAFLAFAGVLLAAFTTEAVAGFGGTLLALTLGSHLYPLEELVPVLVPLNLVLTAYMAVRYRGHVEGKLLATRALPLMGAGLVLGQLLWPFVRGPTLRAIYGVLVLAVSARELRLLLFPSAEATAAALRPLSRWSAASWFLGAGVIHGIYATGGPPLVYVLGRSDLPKTSFRSTLAAVFLLLNSMLVGTFLANGRLDAAVATRVAWLLPVVALAILLGEWGHDRVAERTFRIVVYTLLAIAGATLFL